MMGLRVTDTNLFVQDAVLRMPFHFGNVHMEECPRLLVETRVAFEEGTERGLGMGAVVPMWFLKQPDMTLQAGIDKLVTAVEHAATLAEALPEQESVFAFWSDLYARQAEWGRDVSMPPLLSQYGTSIVEQSLIDAHCRFEARPFPEAVRENTLGIDLGAICAELAGTEPGTHLPDDSLRRVAVRHTVGLTDPLREADIAPEDRLDDGLPQSLEACIERQGIDHFKIKIGADVDSDRQRLRAVADLIEEYHDEYVFSLDANEQYGTIAAFRDQWETLTSDPELAAFFDHLLYVEQPLDREHAFGEEVRAELADWDDVPPVIIDESDDTLDSLSRALDDGYAGTSHKNCKGVFKGIANRCLLEHQRASLDGEYLMSAEDLTTIGPIEVQQDLAAVATLGVDNVERNGHHYLRGLSMYDEQFQDAVLGAHPDLYRQHEDGYPTLDIEDGTIRLDSVVDAPFGYAVEVDTSEFVPLDEWRSRR
jgi:hypothetical protein